jgi:hypothetical protein
MSLTHPQYTRDRQALDETMRATPDDLFHLCELARLLIRYEGFPGAEDIHRDLQATLGRWQLSKDELFRRTREIHQTRPVYRNSDSAQEDWF